MEHTHHASSSRMTERARTIAVDDIEPPQEVRYFLLAKKKEGGLMVGKMGKMTKTKRAPPECSVV